jgi:RNA polymerase sporulation-specific sigma factor
MEARPVGLQNAARLPGRAQEQDAILVRMAQSGDETAYSALISRYRGFVRVKSRGYFLVGAEHEDVVQEAMIGLFKAIRDYDWERQASFKSFADLCITRQLITAIKASRRQKHVPLNGYLSLSQPCSREDGFDRDFEEILASATSLDPADIVVSAWQVTEMRNGFLEDLSPLETDVLKLYTAGRSYQEIAEGLHKHVKSVDNALQRVKRKMLTQISRQQMC